MAVLGRVLFSSAERIDLSDLLSIDSYTAGDFKFLIQSLVGGTTPYIFEGFDIANPGAAIGTATVSINVANSVVYYPESGAGSFFYGLPLGSPLSAPLIPELVQNATNYIYLTMTTTPEAQDTRAFWDPDANGGVGAEFTQNVDTESVLTIQCNVSVASFPTGTVPVAIVVMGPSVIESIEDARDLMFRLGSGGQNPNPYNTFAWPALPNSSFERVETPIEMVSALGPNPFQGGDKNIQTLKQWMDAVMSKIKELGGSTFWYQDVSSTNLTNLFADALGTTFTSKGLWVHSSSTPGLLSWTEDIVIQDVLDPRTTTLRIAVEGPPSTPGSVTLANEQVAFINQQRTVNFNPLNQNVAFINAENFINNIGGAVGLFANLQQGDYVKAINDPAIDFARVEQFYAGPNLSGGITSAALAQSVQLDAPYQGPTSTSIGIDQQGIYQPSDVQVVDRDSPALLAAGGNALWLAIRSDTIEGIASITNTSLTLNITGDDGHEATVTSTTPHGLVNGDYITISGSVNFNGTFIVQVDSTTVFSIQIAGGPFADESGVAGLYAICVTQGTTSEGGIPLENADNCFQTGETIIIAGTTNYNGSYPISSRNVTTFEFAPTGVPVSPGLFTAAAPFAVLASSTITNTGSSVITGNLGLSPGTSVTGFPPGSVIGVQHIADGTAAAALLDAHNVYTTLNAESATAIPSDLDGQTLSAGVYKEASGTFNLATSGNATLTLNGSATDVFVFQAASTLTTGAGGTPTITLTGGAVASNVYWVVGSSATLNVSGTGTFEGNVIALASITIDGGTSNGRLFALTAALTISAATDINVPAASGPDVGGTATLANIFVRDAGGSVSVIQGESIDIDADTINNIKAFIGMESSSQTYPNYEIPAFFDGLFGQENYDSLVTDDVTDRLSRLTGMMADKAQDKTIKLLPDGYTAIVNTPSGSNQVLTFTASPGPGSQVLNIVLPSSAFNGQVDLSGSITLGQNQAAYIVINRNATALFTPSIVISNISAVPLGENVFVIAVRLADSNVWMWDGSQVTVANGPAEGQLQLEATIPPSDIVIVTPSNIPISTSGFLGAAGNYAVLANSTITNVGNTVIKGNLGLYPGTSVTGFPPGTVSGTQDIADAAAHSAQTAASAAYTALFALTPATPIAGGILDGLTLAPGVYSAGTMSLTGTLTLDGGGNPNAQWVFQCGSTLVTASASNVIITNGGQPGNVYWAVGSSATFGTTTSWQGNVIATASITANTGASFYGNLIALGGAITLNDNAIAGAIAPQLTATLGEKLSSFLLDFGGAQINFMTGDVFEADGVTPLGINFTPGVIPANDWLWYSVTLIPSALNPDNTMGGQLLILPASATGTTMENAPRAIFPGNGISLGQVAVQENSSGTAILPIPQADIVQLTAGSGSGGTGLIKVDLYDIIDTTLPSVAPALIDGVTVVTGDTVLFSQLSSGNNEVYQATVVPGSSSNILPNQIVLQMSNANPYAGGNLESVVNAGNVATAQPANDLYFTVDGTTPGGASTPEVAGLFSNVSSFHLESTSAYWMDQPFTAAFTGPLGTVTTRIGWYSTAVGSGLLNLSIYTDNAGNPGTLISTALVDTATLAIVPLTGDYPNTVTASFSGGSLVSGQPYHLVVDPTNVSFPAFNSLFVVTSGLDATNNFLQTSTNSGVSWTVNSTINMNFIITENANTLASNVNGEATSANTNFGVNTSAYIQAQPFTPSVSATVESVLYTATRGTTALGGTYAVAIYTDALGVPGTLISSVNVNPMTLVTNSGGLSTTNDYALTDGLSAALTAGTQYWILWDFTNVTGLGGSGIIYLGRGGCPGTQPPEYSFSSTGPSGPWSISSGNTSLFAVLAAGAGSGNTTVGSYGSDSQYLAVTTQTSLVSQPFVASASGNLVSTAMDLFIANGSFYTGYIKYSVYTDSAGVPGTIVGGFQTQVFADEIQTTPGGLLGMSMPSGTLTSGTTYHLVIDFTHLTIAAGSYEVRIAGDTTSLTNPQSIVSTDSGATYSPVTMGGSPANFNFYVQINNSRLATQAQNNPASSALSMITTAARQAQAFVPVSSGNLTSITIPLGSLGGLGGLSGPLNISIWSNSGGVPGSQLSNTATLNTALLPFARPNWGDFTIFFNPLAVTASTQYFIVLDPSSVSGISSSNPISWLSAGNLANTVPPSELSSFNSGATWTSGGGTVGFIYDVFASAGTGGPFVMAQNLSINSSENETINTVSLGQTFTPSATGFINDVKLQLSIATASPPNSGNLVVKLYSDSSGQPGTLLESSTTLNSATLTTTPTTYTFAFSGGTSLTSGTLYHVILDDSGLAGTVTPGSISWTPQPVFATPYVPEDGDEVIILQGDAFANQVAEFNGTTWQVNPFYRSFNGADFWEISSIITSTLLNNATTQIFSVTALGSENMIVDYSILRSGNKETGTAWITNNGVVAEVTDGGAYTADVGLTFSAAIVSGNIVLSGILDNSGGDGTLKFTLKRWSDGTTGPTGVPSYSPVLPSVAASAFTMSDGSSVPYNCSSPFNVVGLTNITLDFSYMVGLNSGSTVGNLSIFVNGQRIPRFVSSLVTPPSGGTYYTEISNTQIQFTVDITVAPVTVEIIKEV